MFLILTILLQTPNDPLINIGNWFEFGIAGVLAYLIYLLLKYIKQRDKADQEQAKERSMMYREDNRARDERFIEALKSIDVSGQRFVDATNLNIEKFIQLVNKVLEQSNFQTQVLTEVKTIVSKLPSEFSGLKDDIYRHLEQLTMNYELKKKTKESSIVIDEQNKRDQ